MSKRNECPRCGSQKDIKIRDKRLKLLECTECGRVWAVHTPSTHGLREEDWEAAEHHRDRRF